MTTPAPAPLRLVFLGCGYITGVHSRHLRRLRALFTPGYASRDRAKAEAFVGALRRPGAYGDYASAIADPGVDAVVVAVPPKWHLELTLQALAAGKHVLVEKPAFPALGRLRHRARRRAIAPAAWCWSARTTTTSRWRVYLRRQLAARRHRRSGVRLVHDHRAPAEDGGRLAQRRDAWPAATPSSRKASTGCTWPAASGRRSPTSAASVPPRAAAGPDRRAKSMLVAFDYDNGAVGTLLYSREVPSLFRGLRLSKLFGRHGVISFESNGALVLTRGDGLPRLACPGLRDIRGYQAMYRDFVAAIRGGRPPEMSLERAVADHRLMAEVYESLARTGPPVAVRP